MSLMIYKSILQSNADTAFSSLSMTLLITYLLEFIIPLRHIIGIICEIVLGLVMSDERPQLNMVTCFQPVELDGASYDLFGEYVSLWTSAIVQG